MEKSSAEATRVGQGFNPAPEGKAQGGKKTAELFHCSSKEGKKMTLSGNYNHLHLGTAAPAEQFHVRSVRQVTRPACSSTRVDGCSGSSFPNP